MIFAICFRPDLVNIFTFKTWKIVLFKVGNLVQMLPVSWKLSDSHKFHFWELYMYLYHLVRKDSFLIYVCLFMLRLLFYFSSLLVNFLNLSNILCFPGPRCTSHYGSQLQTVQGSWVGFFTFCYFFVLDSWWQKLRAVLIRRLTSTITHW